MGLEPMLLSPKEITNHLRPDSETYLDVSNAFPFQTICLMRRRSISFWINMSFFKDTDVNTRIQPIKWNLALLCFWCFYCH